MTHPKVLDLGKYKYKSSNLYTITYLPIHCNDWSLNEYETIA